MIQSEGTQTNRVTRAAYETLWHPRVRGILARVPFVRHVYGGWRRRHPFDVENGTDTSGWVAAAENAPNSAMAKQINFYAASQPSIVRAALALLPDRQGYVFVDLGCGKGRSVLVASEFEFSRVLGVEISPKLASLAQANVAQRAARWPGRVPVEIEIGDATLVDPGAECVVFYNYHAFGEVLLRRVIDNILQQLDAGLQHAFFVYYNPVHGDVLDACPRFSRWSANTFPYAARELGFGPDLMDTVVIWQTVPARYAPRAGADRRIRVDAHGIGLTD
jgi:SAM-dependent methyltransferase